MLCEDVQLENIFAALSLLIVVVVFNLLFL